MRIVSGVTGRAHVSSIRETYIEIVGSNKPSCKHPSMIRTMTGRADTSNCEVRQKEVPVYPTALWNPRIQQQQGLFISLRLDRNIVHTYHETYCCFSPKLIVQL